MIFRTIVKTEKSDIILDHKNNIFTVGSCFAENMKEKFKYFLFNILSNPHGIIYNPLSIAVTISDICQERVYSEKDLIKHNGIWHSLNHHGKFSDMDIESCLNKINESISEANSFIKTTDLAVITLGTSWVYSHLDREVPAANCHKIPSGSFEKRLLTTGEITDALTRSVDILLRVNDRMNIIFTVSPVRHWRDGAHENQLSKSALLLSINELALKHERIHYFPSYEIVIDELRDYRFFESDMLHPNESAIDYVWERFKETYIDNNTIPILKEIESIRKLQNHRPLYKNSDPEILNDQIARKIEIFRQKFPIVDADKFFVD